MANKLNLANALADAFECKTRPDGEEFYTLQDGAPEWMLEAIYAAHDGGDMLPNDWTYRFARSMAFDIVDGLESGEDLADVVDVASDNLVPCYNGERLAWLASHLSRAALVDEAIEEFGFPNNQRDSNGEIMRLKTERDRVQSELRIETQAREELQRISDAQSEAYAFMVNLKDKVSAKRRKNALFARKRTREMVAAVNFMHDRLDAAREETAELKRNMADPSQPERASDIARLLEERDQARQANRALQQRAERAETALAANADRIAEIVDRMVRAEAQLRAIDKAA